MAYDAMRPVSARTDQVTPSHGDGWQHLYSFGSLTSDAIHSGAPSSFKKDLSSAQSSRSTETGSSSSTPAADPNVIALRDRLLRDARTERQRCLEVIESEAADRLRALACLAKSNSAINSPTQTDPVTVVPSAEKSLDTTTWSKGDDEAQAEAVRSLQCMLGKNSLQQIRGSAADAKIAALEEQLQRQRLHMQGLEDQLLFERTQKDSARQQVEGLEEQLLVERSQKDSARQQVIWNEYDLDAKELALQAAERKLEQQNLDLQVAHTELQMLAQAFDQFEQRAETVSQHEVEHRLGQQKRQIALKDEHISRLLAVLGQRVNPVA